MMVRRIFSSLLRRLNRLYEKNHFYKETLLELSKKCNKKQKNIWFVGSAHYDNIGDLAISEATVKFIENNFNEYNLIEIRLCDYYKYCRAMSKLINKDDIIIMQGGGNMGFLYFDAEVNRREVIKRFKENKIIIFPSTIDYRDSFREKIELKNSISIYNKHKNLIVCARESKSYNQMKQIYKNVILVPDIVLSLGYKNLNNKRDIIIVCLRKDGEKTVKSSELYKYFIEKKDCLFIDNIADEKNISIELRSQIFMNKLNELAKARVVVTDRLHIMIFCTLIEIPCLFVDNSNNKLSGVYDKWIKDKCNYIKKIDFSKKIDSQIFYMSKINVEHTSDFSNDFSILVEKIK